MVLTGTDAIPLDTSERPYKGLFILRRLRCIYEFQKTAPLLELIVPREELKSSYVGKLTFQWWKVFGKL